VALVDAHSRRGPTQELCDLNVVDRNVVVLKDISYDELEKVPSPFRLDAAVMRPVDNNSVMPSELVRALGHVPVSFRDSITLQSWAKSP
jgi:hypothetical protein